MRIMALLGMLAAVEAFNSPAMMPQRAPALRAASSVRMETPAPEKEAEKTEEEAPPAPPAVEYSEALPFLTRRASLGPKGALVGDVGFDPLGFTEIFPLEWLREAEIKHCRVAMLAFVGFVFTDFYTLPGFEYTTLRSGAALKALAEPARARATVARY